LTGCNVLSPFDSPSGDDQLLSAARDCFDRGDYVCASKYYAQVSSASSDTSNSESAFEILAQNGATSSVLTNAILSGTTDPGKLITRLAGVMTPYASATARLAVFHAYQKASLIVETHEQGLIRFLTSLTLAAEVFSEAAATQGIFQQTDLVIDPTTCLASAPTFGAPGGTPGCFAPSGSKLISGPGPSYRLTTATDSDISASPNLSIVNAAILEINNGLAQMQTSGGLSNSSTFVDNLTAAANASLNIDPTDSPIYRGTLLQNGIGTN
jgi:hypothetical protein